MPYLSIDELQRTLSGTVFQHTLDAKKAAGRALGTLIEIITYYLLNEWGITDSLAIERGIEEYGNAEITHNVEFSVIKMENLLSNLILNSYTKSYMIVNAFLHRLCYL
jgi:hypothetical protein